MNDRISIADKKPEARSHNLIPQIRRKTESFRSMNSPIDRILFLQRTIGNQAVGRLIKSGDLQVKLRIGQPGDIYEPEADRVAEQVMRMPDVSEAKDARIQRKCPKCLNGLRGLLGKDEKEQKLQAKETPDKTPEVTPKIEANINTLKGGGKPLPESTRAFFEPRFGQDFSHVRVHTDAKAAEAAQAVNARAFTMGEDVVFGKGLYNPSSSEGRQLLSHELAHTIQKSQSSGSDVPISPPLYCHQDSLQEFEADKMAKSISQGSFIQSRLQGNTTHIARKDDKESERSAATGAATGAAAGAAAGEAVGSAIAAGGAVGAAIAAGALGKKDGKKVCLTFDDGPQIGTDDCLNALGGTIPGTFFLTGKNMASNPAMQKKLIERMLSEGHQIGNHTFTHDPMKSKEYEKEYGDLSDPDKLKKFQENYEKNEAHFRALLGKASPVFKLARLPGNGRFVKVGGKLIFVVATEGMGMSHVTWHFEFGPNGSFGHLKALDWQGIKGVAAEVARLPNSNDIILFHDRHWSGKQALLKAIFSKLNTNSFTFGKLDVSGKCA